MGLVDYRCANSREGCVCVCVRVGGGVVRLLESLELVATEGDCLLDQDQASAEPPRNSQPRTAPPQTRRLSAAQRSRTAARQSLTRDDQNGVCCVCVTTGPPQPVPTGFSNGPGAVPALGSGRPRSPTTVITHFPVVLRGHGRQCHQRPATVPSPVPCPLHLRGTCRTLCATSSR